MPWEPGERAPMSADEQAKADRRLIRAIKNGMCITQLQRSYGATEARVKKLAAEHGLTIRRGNGGNRL